MIDIERKKKIALFFEEILCVKHTIIWDDTNSEKPSGPFLTLKVTPIEYENHSEGIHSPNGNIEQVTRSTLILTAMFYRGDSFYAAQKLRNDLDKISYRDEFFSRMCEEDFALSLLRFLNIADLTSLNQTSHESRAILEIEMRMATKETDAGFKDCGLGSKFPVIIKGEYNNEADEVKYTDILEISK